MKKPTMLSQMDVAAPCSSSWDKMSGDDKVRFCHECKLNVYNISNMSKAEAEELIRLAEGRLCVTFYRRKDGTILTDNCPVGLRKIRDFGRKVAAIVTLGISWVIATSNQPISAGDNKCPSPQATKKEGHTLGQVRIERPLSQMGDIGPYRKVLLNKIAQVWKGSSGPMLMLEINRSGQLISVRILKSSGSQTTDDAAIKTIKTIKPTPLPDWCKREIVTFKIELSGPLK